MGDLLARHDVTVADGGSYAVPMRLAPLLARSASDDPERVRQLFEAAIAGTPLGVCERVDGDDIRFEYPITIQVGRRL